MTTHIFRAIFMLSLLLGVDVAAMRQEPVHIKGEGKFGKALLAYRVHNIALAQKLISECLEEAPSNDKKKEIHLLLANFFVEIENQEEAANHLQKCLSLQGRTDDSELNDAYCLIALGSCDLAIRKLGALFQKSREIETWQKIVVLLFSAEKHFSAVNNEKKAENIRGIILVIHQRIEDEIAKKILATVPNNATIYDFETHFKDCIVDPLDTEKVKNVLLQNALLDAGCGQLDTALEEIIECLEIDPNFPEALEVKAKILSLLSTIAYK